MMTKGPHVLQQLVSTEEAVRILRAEPRFGELVRNTYLDEDVVSAADRFEASGEWEAVRALLGERFVGAVVLDLGAGNGMASRAFAHAGAARVIAVEPDPSDEIGRAAVARICAELPVTVVDACGEHLPLPDGSVEVVYARQVLHHTRDLPQTLRECARVLRTGGVFLACREHIAENQAELEAFLAAHPVHQLTKGEHAYRLREYRAAITNAGMVLELEQGQWDSVINLFPTINSDAELAGLPSRMLRERFGTLGQILGKIPWITELARRRLTRHRPGDLHTFIARKP